MHVYFFPSVLWILFLWILIMEIWREYFACVKHAPMYYSIMILLLYVTKELQRT